MISAHMTWKLIPINFLMNQTATYHVMTGFHVGYPFLMESRLRHEFLFLKGFREALRFSLFFTLSPIGSTTILFLIRLT